MDNILKIKNVESKIESVEAQCFALLSDPHQEWDIPFKPARDIDVFTERDRSHKVKISSEEGQARLLHDLASIELQAMELGVRTLIEFPHSPKNFRQELVQITLEEAKHLQLCLKGLECTSFRWGSFPCHTHLWEAVSQKDDWIDRILIVHRYLEGSGLDASDTILKKLNGFQGQKHLTDIIEVIRNDEIGHVEFGSRWLRKACEEEGLDSNTEFQQRLERLRQQIPKRKPNLAHKLRRQAGFTDIELQTLAEFCAPQK